MLKLRLCLLYYLRVICLKHQCRDSLGAIKANELRQRKPPFQQKEMYLVFNK